METQLKFVFEQIASVAQTVDKFFFERIARAIRTMTIFSNRYPKPFEWMTIFPKQTAQAIRTDDNFSQTDTLSHSNRYQIHSKTANRKECFHMRGHAKGLTKYVRYVH